MDGNCFDDLAKRLATDGVSRRAVLRRVGAGLLGVGGAALGRGAAHAAPDPCAVFCADQPGARGAQCRQTCKACAAGPAGTCFTAAAGSFTCQDLLTDVANCGACGNVCTGTAPVCCGGQCVDASSDVANCGACGNVCGGATDCRAATCANGGCGTVPINELGPCAAEIGNGICVQGICEHCGGPEELCCPPNYSCAYPSECDIDEYGGLCL